VDEEEREHCPLLRTTDRDRLAARGPNVERAEHAEGRTVGFGRTWDPYDFVHRDGTRQPLELDES
jgi:hypothetical protein